MAELTQIQLEIINLMNSGWQLGQEAVGGKVWIQKGGIGKGGDCKRVSLKTLCSLLSKGFIEKDHRGFPASTFRLTEGRQ